VSSTLKTLVVVAAGALGTLFGIGFLLTALLEVQGFGDRDSTPSAWRLVECGVGLAACVVIPAALWQRLLPGRAPIRAAALLLVAIGQLMILGISFKA
jgi:hypothetical protein